MSRQHQILARFEDGVEFAFECGEDETLLGAALRQNLRLLCQCRKAFCGSCKALCSEGEYHFGRLVNVQVLPTNEEEDGIVVTCDTFPRSELVLEFPYTSDRLGTMRDLSEIATRIVRVERISSIVYRLVLEPVEPSKAFPFTAGQYCEIAIPGTDATRAFSFANAPQAGDALEFLIRLVPGGSFGLFLTRSAAIGMELTLRGPMGEFVLRPSPRTKALIGGSTGLAPLVSMLRQAATDSAEATAFHLFFGMQDQESLFYQAELAALAREMPNLTVHLALMDAPSEWQGFQGTAVAAFARHFADVAEKPDVYLCGPAPMVEAARAAARRLGVPEDQIYREEFVASGS
jgi:methane monooxygenase component C